MHDIFTWLMMTCDVCARLFKQRLVVCETAPLTEIHHRLEYSARACEMSLYPAHRFFSALRADRDKFKSHFAWYKMTQCNFFFFRLQKLHLYLGLQDLQFKMLHHHSSLRCSSCLISCERIARYGSHTNQGPFIADNVLEDVATIDSKKLTQPHSATCSEMLHTSFLVPEISRCGSHF